MVKSLFEVL